MPTSDIPAERRKHSCMALAMQRNGGNEISRWKPCRAPALNGEWLCVAHRDAIDGIVLALLMDGVSRGEYVIPGMKKIMTRLKPIRISERA